MTDREKLCREFTELTGGHWHKFPRAQQYKDCFGNICNTNRGRRCACGVSFNSRYKSPNPTYENPADVLRIIIELPMYPDFIGWAEGDIAYDGRCYMPIDYFLEKDKLLKTAIEYLKERKK